MLTRDDNPELMSPLAPAGETAGGSRDHVFISYARADREWVDRLKEVLAPLLRSERLRIWDDSMIPVGNKWSDEISRALQDARVAVLVVTPGFLNSRFIAQHELPPLLDRAGRAGLRVVWIPVRHSLYTETEIRDYQAAHDPAHPLSELSSAEQDKALVEIALHIKEAFEAVARELPPPAPDRSSPAAPHPSTALLERAGNLTESELVEDLLKGRWTLDDLADAIEPDPARAFRLVQRILSTSSGYWCRLLNSFLASRVRLPADELIEFALHNPIGWGARSAALSLLRFRGTMTSSTAINQLAKRVEKITDAGFDTERMIIYALGFVGGRSEIRWMLDRAGALIASYPNEKLGPYAVMAFLHSYLVATSEHEESDALDDFHRTVTATQEHKNLDLGFFDYSDEFQCLRPGKAVQLFRHCRDHRYPECLTAVLAALGNRPNPFLMDELLELGSAEPRTSAVAQAAIHAAAYIGTPVVERRLREADSAGLPTARAARFLAAGLCQLEEAATDIADAIRDPSSTGGSWTNDVRGNALWAAGELGRKDPGFARELLDPLKHDPKDPIARGLAWIGLAKAGCAQDRAAFSTAFETATGFVERLHVATAAALAGFPEFLPDGIRATIDNHSPVYRLIAHVKRDVQAALQEHGGKGGQSLLLLMDLGAFD